MAGATPRGSAGRDDLLAESTAEATRSDVALTVLLARLSGLGPCIPLHADSVTVLRDPGEFHAWLLREISTARERVRLASLYLGSGPLAAQLVRALGEATARQPQLRLSFIFDAQRGMRDHDAGTSSAAVLAPLADAHPDRVAVHLFRTPALIPLLRMLLPERWNEVFGVMHLKVYLIDSAVLLTGANLADDYFSTRQDRYYVIRAEPQVLDWFSALLDATEGLSSRVLGPGHAAAAPASTLVPHAPPAARAAALSALMALVSPLAAPAGVAANALASPRSLSKRVIAADADRAWLVPTIQLGAVGLRQDERICEALFTLAPERSLLTLALAYFNLPPRSLGAALLRSRAHTLVVTTHPAGSAFAGARGVSGLIPRAYSRLLDEFLAAAAAVKAPSRSLDCVEYLRAGWSFHCKGLWLTPASQATPIATVIGSSNYSARSVARDFEAQAVLLTTNERLRGAMERERAAIVSQAHAVTRDQLRAPGRAWPIWLPPVLRAIRSFF